MKALIMVGSAPSGLELDVPTPAKFAEAEKAFEAGDLDRVAEIETHRSPEQVNQEMRKLCYAMNRQALSHEARQLGNRLPNTDVPAFDHLAGLNIPVLIVVGTHDTPYILAAADYMVERIPFVQKVTIADATHLPNMDQPEEFQKTVKAFLKTLPS